MNTIDRQVVAPVATGHRADKGWGRNVTDSFRQYSLQITAWMLVFLPVVVFPHEHARDADLQREWNEVQSNKSQQKKSDWWRHINLEELNKYIQAGADINISDERRWTPLHSAARYNSDTAVLAALVKAGAVIGARNKSGDTPLHWAAAENKNVAIITSLIRAGANVNERDNFGWMPLHTAAESNSNPEVIEILLAAGAKRRKRAYFVLFRPRFLLKHNSNISDTDKETAMAILQASDESA